MAATAVTATPIPAGDTIGAVSPMIYHQVFTAAAGAVSYSFAHGLPYTPTWAVVIPILADNVAATAANSAHGFCPADTTATVIAVNVGGNGTYHVIYG